MHIPAGVDSLTAAEAMLLAEDSFVSIEREEEADRLKMEARDYRDRSDTIWYYLELQRTDDHDVSEQDNLESIRAFNEAAEYIREMDNLQRNRDISEERMKREYAQLVGRAIDAFEKSLMLNPFDNEVRLWLGQLYGIKAARLNESQEHLRAIEVLEKLARLEQGEHVVFYALAENYFSIENYEAAAINFDRAATTLRQTVPMSDYYRQNRRLSPRDASNLFIYTYFKGSSYLNMFDARRALAIFDEAKNLATTEDERQSVQSEIDFINWDSGNIRASMDRERIITELVNRNRLDEAQRQFSALIPTLRTTKARDEIHWRLGIVEYRMGRNADAAERLLALVNRTRKDDRGIPVDPDYVRYVNDYGLICYNIAQDYLDQRNRQNALKYFMQSATVNWENRARANLQIANMLINNVERSMEFARLAEEESDSLNEQDKRALFSLLTDLHRRMGNLEDARKYHEIWRRI